MYLNVSVDAIRTDDCYASLYPPLSSDEYGGLKDSIAQHGFIGAILVAPDPEDPQRYLVLDGHHRLRIVRELGHLTIPCQLARTPHERLAALLANVHRRHLNRTTIQELLEQEPTWKEVIVQQYGAELRRSIEALPETVQCTIGLPETPPAPATSAEIAEMQNKLAQAERAMRKLIKDKQVLEEEVECLRDQMHREQARLTTSADPEDKALSNQLVAKYERELATLRQRLVEQSQAVKVAQDEAAKARDAIEAAARAQQGAELRAKIHEDEILDLQAKLQHYRATVSTPEKVAKMIDEALCVVKGIGGALSYALPPWEPAAIKSLRNQLDLLRTELTIIDQVLDVLGRPPADGWDPDSPYTGQTEQAKRIRNVVNKIAGPDRRPYERRPWSSGRSSGRHDAADQASDQAPPVSPSGKSLDNDPVIKSLMEDPEVMQQISEQFDALGQAVANGKLDEVFGDDPDDDDDELEDELEEALEDELDKEPADGQEDERHLIEEGDGERRGRRHGRRTRKRKSMGR